MSIQDLIFTLGGVFFIISLIPAMRNPSTAIPFGSSFATGVVLWTFSATCLSLGLVGGSIANFITGTCWLFLAGCRRTQKLKAPTTPAYTGDELVGLERTEDGWKYTAPPTHPIPIVIRLERH